MPVAEAELGEFVQQGKVEAFTALYDAHDTSVHDFLLRLVRDPTAAKDLTQTTSIRRSSTDSQSGIRRRSTPGSGRLHTVRP